MRASLIPRLVVSAVAILGAHASSALALPRLKVQPVTLEGYAGDTLKVRVELPCGSRFYGLIASAQGDQLRLAAALVQEPLACTTMPTSVLIGVDYLDADSYQQVSALVVQPAARVQIAPIDELQTTAPGPAARLTAVYVPRCGRRLGLLIHRVGKERLELGFAEQLAEHRAEAATCAAAPTLRTIKAIALSPARQVAALHDPVRVLKKAYQLATAPVDPASLQVLPGLGVSIRYLRACNEAPVGLILSSLQRRSASAPSLEVGMLVARYPNMRCAAEAPGRSWERFSEGALQLPKAVIAVGLNWQSDLHLSMPSHLLLQQGRSVQRLQVQYYAACGRGYAVYGRDRRGMLAVGIVQAPGPRLAPPGSELADGASSCKKALAEVSLAQPFVASGVHASELYPMRIKGI